MDQTQLIMGEEGVRICWVDHMVFKEGTKRESVEKKYIHIYIYIYIYQNDCKLTATEGEYF